jgi:undecaprenyl diphosphate synthase
MRIVEAEEHGSIRALPVPHHVSCIMDGNGRWAQMRGEERSKGHAAAESAVDAAVDACLELGVKWLSVYAFSTENWSREPAEIQFLMSLQEWLLREEKRARFKRLGVRLRFVGDLSDARIPEACRSWLRECEELTEDNTTLEFAIAFNYGGRAELAHAIEGLAASGHPMKSIGDDDIRAHLYCPEMPDIDLLVRTSSEQRLSNYFPWHTAYSEFVFTDTLWPDFREGHLYSAVAEYQTRKRRKGGKAAPHEG